MTTRKVTPYGGATQPLQGVHPSQKAPVRGGIRGVGKITSPGKRFMRKIVKPSKKNIKGIWKLLKQQELIGGRVKKYAGRNNQGKITVRHQGGGVKQLYRNIDYKREWGRYSINIVEDIHYNPISSGFIALMSVYQQPPKGITNPHAAHVSMGRASLKQPKRWYILAADGLKKGDILKGDALRAIHATRPLSVSNNNKGPAGTNPYGEYISTHKTGVMQINSESPYALTESGLKVGESNLLKNIEAGKEVFNIDGKWIRSAGTFGTILKHLDEGTQIKMPSGEILLFNKECRATLGRVSNVDANKICIGKAGVNRKLNIRPTVRGEAMNAKDHSHGGKSHGKGGRVKGERTAWGKLAKRVKTSSRRGTSSIARGGKDL